MIINFSVKNWMSFREEASFSMIVSRERQHKERLPRIKKYRMNILPVAAIYGGNASGKTNLFKALKFTKKMIVEGIRPSKLIPVEPFRLDKKSKSEPSKFYFELLINDNIYEYTFSVTRKSIVEEKLTHILSNKEHVLYYRQFDKYEFFDKKNEKLDFVSQGTRENQLFLTNSITQKIESFKFIYDWFEKLLILISPNSGSRISEYYNQGDIPLYRTINEILPQLDTGISSLSVEDIDLDNLFFKNIKENTQENFLEGQTLHFVIEPTKERLMIYRENNEIVMKKLMTYHSKADGTEEKFEMQHESDGSQRIIDLLPAFINLSSTTSKKVYFIDEIDQSLHTLLIHQLLESYFLSCCSKSRSQMLFTTHNVLLMVQKLLRRDEMWITERDHEGPSYMMSISDYKDVRYDKNIQKSYLQGRLGGIPRILFKGSMNPNTLMQNNE